MAHYAQINNNIVQQVLVMDNEWTDQECQDWLTANVSTDDWVQTSYNNNFRKQYAGVGYTYDKANDVFILPKPFASWTLDASFDWQPPTAMPDDDKKYNWNESTTTWDEIT